ncbi:glycerophosphodiester phosphodiesterase [Litorihabitans aurantiacus]|uniref:Glycerophosphoryl diester phosphodiesterase YhdW n=1 Tax=Litorihabitans aurantiacus TaxID=1930061 RepID=A0AA38CVS3_9MICO|nr:glycerophosphodiester phosphodiesterase family protein [Litorihabitans aurantiacus]GMA32607.1 putative glycerophosphoryl diester phosphodiesterase YhdW [Litorihabitans aurantiacus]
MTRLLTPAPGGRPLVVAHRGASAHAPQNTLPAFELACRAGADAIELDLQLTRDRGVAVFHDDTVDALTDGSGAVADLTLAQLHALDAGSSFAPEWAGTRVPAWEDVLDVVRAHPGTDLLVEVKGSFCTAEVAPMLAAIEDAGMAGRVVVQSFWPDTVAAVRDVAPHLPRGLLVASEPRSGLLTALDLGAAVLNPLGTLLAADPGLVGRAHERGLRVMPWTLNEAAHWAAATEHAVDGIITDHPAALLAWQAEGAAA